MSIEKRELIKKILLKDKILLSECIEEILDPKNKKIPKFKQAVNNPEAVRDFITWLNLKIGLQEREHFLILYLNSNNKVLDHEILWKGTLDQCQIYPREIITGCLKKNARSFILVHNHPSQNTTPSPEDVSLTERLENLSKAFDLNLHDHLIVNAEQIYSIKSKRTLKRKGG